MGKIQSSEVYDAVVVGCGPGGLLAAETLALKNLKVLAVDSKSEIGFPVRCAEGVSKIELEKFFLPEESLISSKVKGAKIFAPDGTCILVEEDGYILERRNFDKFLAEKATESGVKIMLGTTVVDLVREGDKVKGVIVEKERKILKINSSLVVGADGISSRIGRLAGLDTRLRLSDLAICAEFLLSGIESSEYCEIYLDQVKFPGGYSWIFPKGENKANVGLGIVASRASDPLRRLKEWVREFPSVRILSTITGGVPVAPPPERTVCDGLILVGDAARQTDPLSGAGIINAMQAGKIAGEVGADAVKDGDVSSQKLVEYEERWRGTIGELNKKLYRMKEMLTNLGNQEINRIASSYAGRRLKVDDILRMISVSNQT